MPSFSPWIMIGLRQHGLLGAVEIAHEGGDATLVEQFDILGLDTALVGQENADTGIEESQFAQAMFQGCEDRTRSW